MAHKHQKNKSFKSGAAPAVPSGLVPLEPSHAPQLRRLFSASSARAWCCFTPFLYFTSQPGRNQIFWKEYKNSPVILYRKTRNGGDRWDLYTLAANSAETSKYAVGLMDSLNGDGKGRVLWVEEPQLEYIKGLPGLEPSLRDREYFYDTALVTAMKGPGFEDVRKRVNRFAREHPDCLMEPLAASRVHDCETLHGEWMRRYDSKENPAPLLDHFYTERALEKFEAFGPPDFYCWTISLENRIAGFAIAGCMAPGLANFFALKTAPGVFGLATFFRWRILQMLGELGFNLVNDASDLNLPGLKRHKSKFRPVEYLNIYRVDRKK